jgi:NADH-ubiquinone oxidoreductase chain 1
VYLWGIIPFGQGLTLSDFSMGILYTLALSSLGVYGILFAGWSANSKYAFLGSLRSTAAMISYELILSSAVLIIILLTGSFNFTTIIESQQAVWFIVPLLPVFIFYFISILAETSRTPFDLQEANPIWLHTSLFAGKVFLLYTTTVVKINKIWLISSLNKNSSTIRDGSS